MNNRTDLLRSHFDWLALPHDVQEAPNEAVARMQATSCRLLVLIALL